MKIILNKCYGGFSVSDKAYELYAEKKGISLYRYWDDYQNKTMHKGSSLITFYFTKDFGDSVQKSKMDWKTHLYLDEGHRDDPILVEVVEELGKKASGSHAKLVVVEIPDGMDYVIDDYDGFETLHENVKVW
jgi:hypothetical protein